jgi:hypothetical protein
MHCGVSEWIQKNLVGEEKKRSIFWNPFSENDESWTRAVMLSTKYERDNNAGGSARVTIPPQLKASSCDLSLKLWNSDMMTPSDDLHLYPFWNLALCWNLFDCCAFGTQIKLLLHQESRTVTVQSRKLNFGWASPLLLGLLNSRW